MSNDELAYAMLVDWVSDYHVHGDCLDCLKIVFDGFAEDDDGDKDKSSMSYAVFIPHDADKIETFPEHEFAYGQIVHRAEDACIFAWVDTETGDVFIGDPGSVEFGWDKAVEIILALKTKYYGEDYVPQLSLSVSALAHNRALENSSDNM